MSYKSDVKPVTLTANGAFYTGRTRVRAIMAQPTNGTGVGATVGRTVGDVATG